MYWVLTKEGSGSDKTDVLHSWSITTYLSNSTLKEASEFVRLGSLESIATIVFTCVCPGKFSKNVCIAVPVN